MIIIAASLYLPEHIATIAGRASFYWAGEETAGESGNPLISSASFAKATARTIADVAKSLDKNIAKETLKEL